MIALDRKRFIVPAIDACRRYAVNILAEDQQWLSDCFAGASVTPAATRSAAPRGARRDRAAAPRGRDRRAWSARSPSASRWATTTCTSVGWRRCALDEPGAPPLLYHRKRYLRIERATTAQVVGKPESPGRARRPAMTDDDLDRADRRAAARAHRLPGGRGTARGRGAADAGPAGGAQRAVVRARRGAGRRCSAVLDEDPACRAIVITGAGEQGVRRRRRHPGAGRPLAARAAGGGPVRGRWTGSGTWTRRSSPRSGGGRWAGAASWRWPAT